MQGPQDRLLQFFSYEHLPERLRNVSRPFYEQALLMISTLPSNPERAVALRKLLESKDCAVRAALYKEEPDTRSVLKCKMQRNDAKAETVGKFLQALLLKLWTEEESFSGKRPFGNSGWKSDVFRALAEENFVPGQEDEEGWFECLDDNEADAIIAAAIKSLVL